MENEPTIQDNAPRQDNNMAWWLLAGAGGLGFCCLFVLPVVLIAVLTVMGPSVGNVFSQINRSLDAAGTARPVATTTSFTYPEAKDNALGNPNAPVRIVEYGDFQCPYCAAFWRETEKALIDDYVRTGKVYFTYRSMGAFIGPESGRAAEAAYCAGEQERFWQYHDTLYANQGAENSGAFADDRLVGFSAELGLDREQFDACLRSSKYESRVKEDVRAAELAGVQATPTFVINENKLIEGAQPYDVFTKAIADILGLGGQ